MNFRNHDSNEYPNVYDSGEVVGYATRYEDDDSPTGVHEGLDQSDMSSMGIRQIRDETGRWTIGLLKG